MSGRIDSFTFRVVCSTRVVGVTSTRDSPRGDGDMLHGDTTLHQCHQNYGKQWWHKRDALWIKCHCILNSDKPTRVILWDKWTTAIIICGIMVYRVYGVVCRGSLPLRVIKNKKDQVRKTWWNWSFSLRSKRERVKLKSNHPVILLWRNKGIISVKEQGYYICEGTRVLYLWRNKGIIYVKEQGYYICEGTRVLYLWRNKGIIYVKEQGYYICEGTRVLYLLRKKKHKTCWTTHIMAEGRHAVDNYLIKVLFPTTVRNVTHAQRSNIDDACAKRKRTKYR